MPTDIASAVGDATGMQDFGERIDAIIRSVQAIGVENAIRCAVNLGREMERAGLVEA
jgi:hypothetical protein